MARLIMGFESCGGGSRLAVGEYEDIVGHSGGILTGRADFEFMEAFPVEREILFLCVWFHEIWE